MPQPANDPTATSRSLSLQVPTKPLAVIVKSNVNTSNANPTSPAIGGTCKVIFMMLATPLLADIAVVHFGPPEIFALVFFGIAVASSVGAKTLWKGWLSVLLGLLMATLVLGGHPPPPVAWWATR